jgi:hypothetical protein
MSIHEILAGKEVWPFVLIIESGLSKNTEQSDLKFKLLNSKGMWK